VSAKPRFVFDTSAIISAALLKRSVSRQAFDKALDEGELLVSAETIVEATCKWTPTPRVTDEKG
jgi:hypothetical protein